MRLLGSLPCGSAETDPTSIHEGFGFDPWPHLAGQGSGVATSTGVGHECGSDLVWRWLWHRPAAIAPIQPLAWERPYAAKSSPKKQKKKKKVNPKINHGLWVTMMYECKHISSNKCALWLGMFILVEAMHSMKRLNSQFDTFFKHHKYQ